MSDLPVIHLGDGVYAKFDGYQIELMANDAIYPTDTIYLTRETFDALVEYAKKLGYQFT